MTSCFSLCWGRLKLPQNSLEHKQQTSTQSILFLKLILPIPVKMSSGIYICLLSSTTSYVRPFSSLWLLCKVSFIHPSILPPAQCWHNTAVVLVLLYQYCSIGAVVLVLSYLVLLYQGCCISAVILGWFNQSFIIIVVILVLSSQCCHISALILVLSYQCCHIRAVALVL